MTLLEQFIGKILLEIRSKTFNFEEFKKLKTYKECWQYAKKHLEFLGLGSSRMTFLLSSKTVLKIATNEAGLAQNKEEVEVSARSTGFVTKVKRYQNSYFWVVSDLVKEFTPQTLDEFKVMTGVDFKELQKILFTYSETKKMPATKNDFILSVYEEIKNNNLAANDLAKIEHWGYTADGRVLILDYGLSDMILKKHYSDSPDEKTALSHEGQTMPYKDKEKKEEPDSGTRKKAAPIFDPNYDTAPSVYKNY